MSTNHHTPHATRAPLTSAGMNLPLGQLDAAISAVVLSGSGTATTVTGAGAASGQKVVPVASTTGFAVGDPIFLSNASGNVEAHVIASISAGVSLTTTVNLTYTHPAGSSVSKSPAELVLARGSYATLPTRLDRVVGGLQDRGTGLFAIGESAKKAYPVRLGTSITGPDVEPAAANAIGIYSSTEFVGNFTAMVTNDPGFVWGHWHWTTVNPAGAPGINTIYGYQSEIGLRNTVSNTFAHIMAGSFDMILWENSVGNITLYEGVRIATPALRAGAAWTVGQYIGLHITAPGTFGTTRFALLTDGGPSRFTGRLDVDTVVTGWNGSVELQANFSRAAGATLLLDGNTVGASTGNATVFLSKALSGLIVHDGTAVVGSIRREGQWELKELASNPASPPAGYQYLFAKNDGKIYTKTSAGTVTALF